MNSIPNYPTISHTPKGNTPGSRPDQRRRNLFHADELPIVAALRHAGYTVISTSQYQRLIVRQEQGQ